MNYAVKLLSQDATTATIHGYGAVWGGHDLAGEYFTPATDFWLNKLSATPPVLYNHGFDEAVKKTVIGQVVEHGKDDVGLWIKAQIDRSNKYAEAVLGLIEQGRMGWSSGAVSHLVERTRTGQTKRLDAWPVAEMTLTPEPCEPRLLGVEVLADLAEVDPSVKAYLKVLNEGTDSAGGALVPDETDAAGKGAIRQKAEGHKTKPARYADVPDEDFADPTNYKYPLDKAHIHAALSYLGQAKNRTAGGYSLAEWAAMQAKAKRYAAKYGIQVSDDAKSWVAWEDLPSPVKYGAFPGTTLEGTYEDLIEDLGQAVNQQLSQNSYGYVLATYPDSVIVRVYSPNGLSEDDDEGEQYFRYGYRLGEDGEPELTGEPTPVAPAYVPVRTPAAEPVLAKAFYVADQAGALGETAQALFDRRVKSGRMLSDANRQALKRALEAVDGAAGALRDLLTASEPKPKGLAPDQLRQFDLLRLYVDAPKSAGALV